MPWGLCSSLFDECGLYKKKKEIRCTFSMLHSVRMKTLEVIALPGILFVILQIEKNSFLGNEFSNCLYLLSPWICMYGVNKSVVVYHTTLLFVVIHLVCSLKRTSYQYILHGTKSCFSWQTVSFCFQYSTLFSIQCREENVM